MLIAHTKSNHKTMDKKQEVNKKINYIVVCTPRSGSTLLFDLFKNNNLATKKPTDSHYEPFHRDQFKTVAFKNLDLKEYIEKQFENYSVEHKGLKISGFKIFIRQIEKFLEEYNTVNDKQVTTDDLLSLFPENTKCIKLIRKDEILQAISWYKAKNKKQWKIDMTTQKAKDVNMSFNYLKIFDCLQYINTENRKTSDMLNKFFIPQLTLTYEEYIKDLRSTVVSVLKYLEIEQDEITEDIGLRVQRNLNSRILYVKFIFVRKKNMIMEKIKNTLFRERK